MGLALYRKYRPKSLADVVGQDHIVNALQKAIKTDAISHAYLLTGPRGVGKTSIARILAHELNGLPYSDDATHLDIIEIDAASNRRIDEIRELRDKVHIAPTSAKYKVYIIDEVHMLTREAFNALLKTLEEPPAHAIFILATTEAHKIPDTILSRTQRYTFKPITANDTAKHLQSLAKLENINIDDAALALLAEHAAGSFRDSINLLDQLAGQKEKITAESIQQMLGLPSLATVNLLLSSITSGDIVALLGSIDTARSEGVQAQLLAKQLIQLLRSQIIEGQLQATQKVMLLLDNLLKVTASAHPYAQLELSLARYIAKDDAPTANRPVQAPAPKIATVTKQETPAPQQAPVIDIPEPKPPQQDIESVQGDTVDPADYWQELLKIIKAKHNTLYSMLRMAEPVLDDTKLTLTFGFAFHQKQIAQAANAQHIAEVVTKIIGKPIQVVCVVGEKAAKTATHHSVQPAVKHEKSAPLSDVSNIFEGAELLE